MDRSEDLQKEFLEEPFSQEYGMVLEHIKQGAAVVTLPIHPKWLTRVGLSFAT